MIAILDYGMANLRSVQKGFEHVGHRAEIVTEPEQIDRAERFVLPGVGAFQDAVAALRERSFVEPIIRHIQKGKPFLGICLGLQMLFDVGYEDGEHCGMGVLPGKCVRFDVDDAFGLKVPHMGWNQLNVVRPSPLMRDLPADSSVYFVHSYHIVPGNEAVVATTTDYGRPFVSSIWRDNVVATQFHPEKSQKVGLQILSNFAAM
ncbi:imidazole glycerol phosphate synthase subunit HisH [Humisphaera borealis]|uniref:Imidazole glycerol phosphate synthase subunit HisH n=1 Tax=Humisphaera borealis TaxID=2807512 RepID=A0A7M2WW44_9BACT|nr:imidazole glycerol phosphate synthase subunit HisH [Humisphaera borealis]QOV89686.1 imidazole glycerol phosphate synthase subunit HisH [Humisphaera borealis]